MDTKEVIKQILALLPLEIGTDVWRIETESLYENGIEDRLVIKKRKLWSVSVYKNSIYYDLGALTTFNIEEINDRVFTNESEANKRLKQLKKNTSH